MGLKDFFDDIIPNELKGNLGKIAAAGAAAYFGYKYAPKAIDAAKSFIGQPAMTSGPFAPATGLRGFVSDIATKYPTTSKFVKGFGQQIAGQIGQKGDQSAAEIQARYEAQSKAMANAMKSKSYSIPSGVPMQNVGTFQSSRAHVPGFKNPHVNESLNMMSYFMQDLNDNGKIDSSALYAEAPRGVTIGLPSSKSMKMSI